MRLISKIKFWFMRKYCTLTVRGRYIKEYLRKIAEGEYVDSDYNAYYEEVITNYLARIKNKLGYDFDRRTGAAILYSIMNEIREEN